MYSTVSGLWYFLDEGTNSWKPYVVNPEEVLADYTEEMLIQWFKEHPEETQKIHNSLQNGDPFPILPPNDITMSLLSLNIMENNPLIVIYTSYSEEVRALTILSERKGYNWSISDIYGKAFKNVLDKEGHYILDLVGQAPVVGEWADVINGVWYTIEGDGVNAGLSYAGAIPILGNAATASKIAVKAIKLGDGKNLLLVLKKGADGLYDFGDRKLLRKVMNITDKTMEAHHIIPWEKCKKHPLVQKAAENGFHLNDALNGIELKKYTKIVMDGDQANHPAYDTYVWNRIEQLYKANGGTNLDPSKANEIIKKKPFA